MTIARPCPPSFTISYDWTAVVPSASTSTTRSTCAACSLIGSTTSRGNIPSTAVRGDDQGVAELARLGDGVLVIGELHAGLVVVLGGQPHDLGAELPPHDHRPVLPVAEGRCEV